MSAINTIVALQIVTIWNAIESFQQTALSGKSQSTKKWYQSRLSLLAKELGETRPLADVLEVDLFKVREKWESQNLAPDTLHGYIRATRRLFKWLYKRGLIEVDLIQDLNLPRLPRRGKRGISDHHATLIIEAAKAWSVRDYAILCFFASSSARRGGVSGLQLSDIQLDAPEPQCRQVRVMEKGSKERTVIIDSVTLEAMRKWIAVRPGNSSYVFVSAKGEPLKVDSISEIVDRYKKRLGITGKCSPHEWRHAWFRHIISNGLPLTQAAQIGGHEQVQLTYQYYGQYAVDELQQAYDKYFTPDQSQSAIQ